MRCRSPAATLVRRGEAVTFETWSGANERGCAGARRGRRCTLTVQFTAILRQELSRMAERQGFEPAGRSASARHWDSKSHNLQARINTKPDAKSSHDDGKPPPPAKSPWTRACFTSPVGALSPMDLDPHRSRPVRWPGIPPCRHLRPSVPGIADRRRA